MFVLIVEAECEEKVAGGSKSDLHADDLQRVQEV